MALSADIYDPWNATVQSAAAGSPWRADVQRSDGPGGLLNIGVKDRASQFEYLVRDQTSETPQNAFDTPDAGETAEAEGAEWFDTVIDVINPLQHIPIVSTIYRELSGDEISAFSRVAGGTLFFGPFGTLSAMANVAVEESTGKDLGEHVMAFFQGDEAATVADAVPFADPDAPQAASASASEPVNDPLAQALLTNPQAIAAAAQPTAQAPVRAPAATPPTDGAVPLSALPADILEALQSGQAARPLSPQGFAFPEPSQVEAPAAAPVAATADVAGEPLAAVTDAAKADALSQRVVLQTQSDRAALIEAVESRPAGSTATEGGWFSSAMLQALSKYESAQSLTARTPGPSLNVSN